MNQDELINRIKELERTVKQHTYDLESLKSTIRMAERAVEEEMKDEQ